MAKRRCGKCGKTGHNSRTCKKNPVLKTAKRRTCGKCGNIGHNSRTCRSTATPKLSVHDIVVQTPEVPKKKRVIKCSICGSNHTKSRCPWGGKKAVQGPKKMKCGHFAWWKAKDKTCDKCNQRWL